MKKYLLILSVICLFANTAFADVDKISVYSEKNMFGLKNTNENITKAEFKKLIAVGNSVWLVQKGSRYGLINNEGNYIVYPKYRHAERYLGKFVKLGNDNDFGLYDGDGNMVIPPVYSSIELLYSKLFLTCKHFKYGVVDFSGKILLLNEFDDIYMPDRNTMRVLYEGEWFEFSKVPDSEDITGQNKITINNKEFTFKKLMSDTGIRSGYYAVSTTDYVMKILSSLSPAYEDTVDDLMLSHGAETVNIIKNPVWMLQFPYIYAKKYGRGFITPNNGPLSKVKQRLKRRLIKN